MTHKKWAFEGEQGPSRAEEHAQDLLRQAMSYVMADAKGRRFVRWIFALTGEGASISHDNALRMARYSGARDVGLQVRDALEALDPAVFDLLVKEGRNERDDLRRIDRDDRGDY